MDTEFIKNAGAKAKAILAQKDQEQNADTDMVWFDA